MRGAELRLFALAELGAFLQGAVLGDSAGAELGALARGCAPPPYEKSPQLSLQAF